MNVLIVHAHPEPQSLNGALKDLALRLARIPHGGSVLIQGVTGAVGSFAAQQAARPLSGEVWIAVAHSPRLDEDHDQEGDHSR